MGRPTENAIGLFTQADKSIAEAGLKLKAVIPSAGDRARHDAELAMWRGLWFTNQGLIELSSGLRATYMLLEEIQRSLSRHP